MNGTNMTDRELLELAAKAAGIELYVDERGYWLIEENGEHWYWNPLTDDGDALRLAVKLGISFKVFLQLNQVWADHHMLGNWIEEKLGEDPCAATRRAIVRAAAEIGKNL